MIHPPSMTFFFTSTQKPKSGLNGLRFEPENAVSSDLPVAKGQPVCFFCCAFKFQNRPFLTASIKSLSFAIASPTQVSAAP